MNGLYKEEELNSENVKVCVTIFSYPLAKFSIILCV